MFDDELDDDVSVKDDYTDEQLQAAAQRVANVYARIVNKRFGCTIPVPVRMKFDLELESMTTARYSGRAHSSMLIDINMTLFRENIQHILNDTIPHEMGHLVQFNKFDLKGVSTPGHGVHWMEAMRVMGKVPKKFHKMDTSNAVKAYKDNVKAIKDAAKAKEKAAKAKAKKDEE
jgi:predicted SprT family Zn-dependent metalloprotease